MIDFKRFRADKNIPQKRLVEILGFSQAHISELEKGSRPLSKEAYKKLYDVYGDELDNYEIDTVNGVPVNKIDKIPELERELAETKQALYLSGVQWQAEREIVKQLEARLKDKEELIDLLKNRK